MISARQQAVQIAREKLSRHPVYLDTETTGIERNSEIIEISIIDHDGQVLYDSLVKPSSGKIPFDVIQIHGITMEMVLNAPRWLSVWPEVREILSGRQVGIYNADFDIRMMQQSHAAYRMRWQADPTINFFCIMKLYAQFYGEWNRMRGSYRWQSLDAAGKQCKIPLPNSHRAKDDTLLAREVLHYMAGIKG
jgi:DNA polymerase-3 subunit epsilon